YAQKLRDFVRQMRRMAEGAKDSVQRDFGDDFKDVDWQKLDPRQYDPRRIVREALVEEDTAIRESKRRERSSNESAPTSGTASKPIPLLMPRLLRRCVSSPRSNASKPRRNCAIAPPEPRSTPKPPEIPPTARSRRSRAGSVLVHGRVFGIRAQFVGVAAAEIRSARLPV